MNALAEGRDINGLGSRRGGGIHLNYESASSAANMDGRPLLRVRLRVPQDLASYGSNIEGGPKRHDDLFTRSL